MMSIGRRVRTPRGALLLRATGSAALAGGLTVFAIGATAGPPAAVLADQGGDQGTVWVSNAGDPLVPTNDPHLRCADVQITGSAMKAPSGSFTILGVAPTGGGAQAYPAAPAAAAAWTYDAAAGGVQPLASVSEAALVAGALANGDLPHPQQGLHLELSLTDQGGSAKHATFWLDCSSGSSSSSSSTSSGTLSSTSTDTSSTTTTDSSSSTQSTGTTQTATTSGLAATSTHVSVSETVIVDSSSTTSDQPGAGANGSTTSTSSSSSSSSPAPRGAVTTSTSSSSTPSGGQPVADPAVTLQTAANAPAQSHVGIPDTGAGAATPGGLALLLGGLLCLGAGAVGRRDQDGSGA